MRFAKVPFTILIPALYAVVAFVLLNLPLNKWFALHAFYVISWPASHLLARESLFIQAAGGVMQWGVIGVLADIVFTPRKK